MIELIKNPLPNCDRALIGDCKLIGYALNPHSERGRLKPRDFNSALRFNLSNWEQLKQAILETLPYYEAKLTRQTAFGKKYKVVLPITGINKRTVNVITIWQFDGLPDGTFNDYPRLITLYIST